MADKQILFYDVEAFQNKQKNEVEITESVFALTELYNKALGKKADIDFSKLVKEPVSYIVNSFWNEHCSNMPEHLNRYTIFFSQTSISEADIQTVFEGYKASCGKMEKVHTREALPIASKKDITFKENRFPKYLDESKRKHYELLKKFVIIANQLQEQGSTTGVIHVQRYAPDVMIENGGIAVNLHRFIQ